MEVETITQICHDCGRLCKLELDRTSYLAEWLALGAMKYKVTCTLCSKKFAIDATKADQALDRGKK